MQLGGFGRICSRGCAPCSRKTHYVRRQGTRGDTRAGGIRSAGRSRAWARGLGGRGRARRGRGRHGKRRPGFLDTVGLSADTVGVSARAGGGPPESGPLLGQAQPPSKHTRESSGRPHAHRFSAPRSSVTAAPPRHRLRQLARGRRLGRPLGSPFRCGSLRYRSNQRGSQWWQAAVCAERSKRSGLG